MTDLANAFLGIANGFNNLFGGALLWDGNVITQAAITYDDAGSIVSGGAATTRQCKVQCDEATTAMRQSPDFVQGDRRIIIPTASLEGQVGTNDRIEFLDGPFAGFWMIQSLENDPANIGWIIWGRRA